MGTYRPSVALTNASSRPMLNGLFCRRLFRVSCTPSQGRLAIGLPLAKLPHVWAIMVRRNMPTSKALRISTVGLRGVVGSGMTAAHVMDFAAAFGTFLETRRPVLIGRDPRASGLMIREGVAAALLACGHDVIDLGVVSTPVLQHAIRRVPSGMRSNFWAARARTYPRRKPVSCSTSIICANSIWRFGSNRR